jgi:NAD(P)-dependent dehydrogenase (short-subunit alcohol dehydrogenase family)
VEDPVVSADTQQPLGSGFGPKSEPHEVLADVDLTGKTAVVTGGYSGIGLETTKALAAKGARVIVPVRSPAKAEENLATVEGNITTAQMDLADISTVESFAAELGYSVDSLDLLINNAGVMATPERRVGPGWEYQFGINHMGHFALTNALMPMLEQAEAPRVVALSSIAHKRGGVLWDDINFEQAEYDKWQAYAQAKSANALFAVGLSPRLEAAGGRAFSVHPGGIFTPLQRDLDVEEQIQLGWLDKDGNPSEIAQQMFKSPSQGCTTTLWAATSPLLADKGGQYCEDCDVAAVAGPDTPAWLGVAPHAVDQAEAERLWETSEALLAQLS